MKRWMIAGLAGGAALFGCPLVLAAAMQQADRPEEDWLADVERYANSPGPARRSRSGE